MSESAPNSPASMAGTKGYPYKGLSEEERRRLERLATQVEQRKRIQSAIIPARTGKAFNVPQGHIIRIVCIEGSQVADTCVFNADDTTEAFWSGRTRVVHGGHLNVGDRLWSTPPRSRPMMTMIADTLEHPEHPHGARSHDVLYCRCDNMMYERVHGLKNVPSCNQNLVDAIAEFGLRPDQVHDPFNVFMTTGINAEGRPFYLPSDSKKGDYIELVAEINCLVAISACPGGSSGPKSNPLLVEVFEPA